MRKAHPLKAVALTAAFAIASGCTPEAKPPPPAPVVQKPPAPVPGCPAPKELHAPALDRRLKDILAEARATQDGARFMEFLDHNHVRVYFADTLSPYEGAVYLRCIRVKEQEVHPVIDHPVIALSPDARLLDTIIAASLPHEAQHFVQDSGGAGYPPSKRIPASDHIWLRRMLEADAQANSVVSALKDYRDTGRGAFLSAAAFTGYDHMFKTALDEFYRRPASLKDGTLKRKVFDAWFQDAAKPIDDLRAVEEYRLYDAAFSRSGVRAPPKAKLDARDIARIGDVQLDQINYLRLPGFRALDDPYYRGGIPEEARALDAAWEAAQKTLAPRPKPR
jgi:hypothetical protein